jgi:hypothetical protein
VLTKNGKWTNTHEGGISMNGLYTVFDDDNDEKSIAISKEAFTFYFM